MSKLTNLLAAALVSVSSAGYPNSWTWLTTSDRVANGAGNHEKWVWYSVDSGRIRYRGIKNDGEALRLVLELQMENMGTLRRTDRTLLPRRK